MTVVAQQMQNSWEKKRKDKEAKYFQEAQALLTKCIAQRTEEFTEAAEELDDKYEKFVLEYASVEDEIRNLWTQLLKEQQKLLLLAEQKHQGVRECEKERERGQVQGMAIAKKAMEDCSRLVTTLRHPE
ncbi:hypothetical protein IEO21_05675 [Rhodonia placenta]|uniref:Uncharacterized protein n=1 Tax=Rhodonia placenta TaxID=104341 RepID=A0A8H7P1H1_9APHY|nr:hypothetical protein IEO21_05675 [Postia placenta]